MSRTTEVVHIDALPWEEAQHGDRNQWKRKRLGVAAGGEQIGASLYEIPPGKRSFPYHFHWANEEALLVVEGSGTLRLPEGQVPIAKGDYVALRASPEGAHQVINTSDKPLRYLMFSTMIEPDVGVYPDSNKIGVFPSKKDRASYVFFRSGEAVDYWDGEG